jgi:hypothetical protein
LGAHDEFLHAWVIYVFFTPYPDDQHNNQLIIHGIYDAPPTGQPNAIDVLPILKFLRPLGSGISAQLINELERLGAHIGRQSPDFLASDGEISIW